MQTMSSSTRVDASISSKTSLYGSMPRMSFVFGSNASPAGARLKSPQAVPLPEPRLIVMISFVVPRVAYIRRVTGLIVRPR